MHTVKEIPFHERTFTLDGEPCNIEDFISLTATSFKDAVQLRSEIAEMAEGFHMYFGYRTTERVLFRMS